MSVGPLGLAVIDTCGRCYLGSPFGATREGANCRIPRENFYGVVGSRGLRRVSKEAVIVLWSLVSVGDDWGVIGNGILVHCMFVVLE